MEKITDFKEIKELKELTDKAIQQAIVYFYEKTGLIITEVNISV